MVRRVVRSSSQDLKQLLLSPAGGRFIRPIDSYDEVYPGVLLGDACIALSTNVLREIGVTHVLNAAKGNNTFYYGGFINTGDTYYSKAAITFMGIPALDTPSFYLRSYFRDAADFIDSAVKSGGKVLVHCQCGISRSATLIAAYLMAKKAMDLQQALITIRSHRSIFPNQGFLSQLCDFEYELRRQGELSTQVHSTDFDSCKSVKDSLSLGSRFPNFSETNYFPMRLALTKSGYRVTSALPSIQRDLESTYRSRSEERIPSSYRDRSLSPPRFRSARSVSVLPDAMEYYERKRSSSLEPEPYYSTSRSPLISTYDITRPFHDSYSYLRLSRPIQYSPPRPITKYYPTGYRALETLAELSSYRNPSLLRTLTPRDRQYRSALPFESYSYASPSYRRTFTTYTPNEGYNPRSFDYTPSRSYRSGYIPSVIRYPSLLSSSLYARILKA